MNSLPFKYTERNKFSLFIQRESKNHIFRLLLISGLIFTIIKATAQDEKSYPSVINFTYTSGHISKHSKDVSHTTRGFTHGFDIVSRNLIPLATKMNDRQKLAYFDVGLHYTNYPMDFLGESFAITFGRSGRLLQINKFQLSGQCMQGLGFCTKPFSQENNKNNAISTHVGFYIHGNLTGTYCIYKNWNTFFALGFSHLSNGAINKPNKGFNVLSTNIGVAYHIKDKTKKEMLGYYKESSQYYFHLIGTYFKTASRSFSGVKYPSYNAHAQIERNIWLHHSLLLSVDYNNNHEIKYPAIKKKEDESNDENNYFGISVGGSWKYSIVDFNLTYGLYLIKPWYSDKKNYILVHFKIYALKNKYLLFGIKAHGLSASVFETGIGIKL